MIARSSWTRTAALVLMGLFLVSLALLFLRNWQGKDTVLLSWPPYGTSAPAFLIGGSASLFALWVLRTSRLDDLKLAFALLGGFLFGGWICFAMLCWAVESVSFPDGLAIERTEFTITRADMDTKGFNRGATSFAVENREGASGSVPVPSKLFDRIGQFRYNQREQVDGYYYDHDRKCLTLHIQRSSGMIRAILRTPAGREFPPELHDCGKGPKAPS